MADVSSREQMERALLAYDEPLLRQVAGQLLRPRSRWPVKELVQRCLATLDDVTLVDRRLKLLEPIHRQILALIGHSGQPQWHLGNLVELVLALGHDDGLQPIRALLDSGFLFPVLTPPVTSASLKTLDHWLSHSASPKWVSAHPAAMRRAVGEEIPLGDPCEVVEDVTRDTEADGLEWPLRLAALWQLLSAAPLRRAQSGGFFKRDLDRLEQSTLLNAPPTHGDDLVLAPGFLAVALALQLGIARANDDEIHVGTIPERWGDSLSSFLESAWAALPHLGGWNVRDGRPDESLPGNPFPSAFLLMLLLLARLPANLWTRPKSIHQWLCKRHPFWRNNDSALEEWTSRFLLGLAFQMRWVRIASDRRGKPVVSLTAPGRSMLGIGGDSSDRTAFPHALLVQPNLEIVAYRQGLSPGLIRSLTRFATWTSIGAACTLQLEPDRTYRALELGESVDNVLQTLQRHGSQETPQSVVDSLRTWSQKRERIRVYASATLLELNSAEETSEALARGLPGGRISDRVIVVADESRIDYSHFRLISTRDYVAKPEQCVEVSEDGVTLIVDVKRSDLTLESELHRFAELVEEKPEQGRRVYRVTPATIAAAIEEGIDAQELDAWFLNRTGDALPPAVGLFLESRAAPAASIGEHVVLQVATEALADGLMQWPNTRWLICERLGPTTLSVQREDEKTMFEQLDELGMQWIYVPS